MTLSVRQLASETGDDPRDREHSWPTHTRMMFKRYEHLFSHTGGRIATTAGVLPALEPCCRTIVVNPTHRFALPQKQKRQDSLQSQAFSMVEMGDSNPGPLICEIRSAVG